MPHRLITDQTEFEQLCHQIRQHGIVAFDSEFITEYTYRPELCLLQLAIPGHSVTVDPFRVENLDPWWSIMADDTTTVVVHGGQAEVRFCLDCHHRPPQKLVDIQIAEGLRSRSYPLAYSTLVNRVLGRRVHGKETRTDWRMRPLSDDQIKYALEDVQYLLEIWKRQRDDLERLGRISWAQTEFQRLVEEIETERNRDGWRRLSGIHKLSRRELAVAIELFNWREHEAEQRNRPARRVLRDDLLIEMARRQPQSSQELQTTRDMRRPDYKRHSHQILESIQRGKAIPESDVPQLSLNPRGENNQDEHVIGKLLGIALANRCAEVNVAMPLVGTSADLRHLVRWHVYGEQDGPSPRLTQGWRAEVCGDLLTDVLDGKIALRVADPESDHPLIFERSNPETADPPPRDL